MHRPSVEPSTHPMPWLTCGPLANSSVAPLCSCTARARSRSTQRRTSASSPVAAAVSPASSPAWYAQDHVRLSVQIRVQTTVMFVRGLPCRGMRLPVQLRVQKPSCLCGNCLASLLRRLCVCGRVSLSCETRIGRRALHFARVLRRKSLAQTRSSLVLISLFLCTLCD